MPKSPKGEKPKAKTPPKSKKLPRKLPDDPVQRAVQIMREATEAKVTKLKAREK